MQSALLHTGKKKNQVLATNRQKTNRRGHCIANLCVVPVTSRTSSSSWSLTPGCSTAQTQAQTQTQTYEHMASIKTCKLKDTAIRLQQMHRTVAFFFFFFFFFDCCCELTAESRTKAENLLSKSFRKECHVVFITSSVHLRYWRLCHSGACEGGIEKVCVCVRRKCARAC